jgi:hypothetical protein
MKNTELFECEILRFPIVISKHNVQAHRGEGEGGGSESGGGTSDGEGGSGGGEGGGNA